MRSEWILTAWQLQSSFRQLFFAGPQPRTSIVVAAKRTVGGHNENYINIQLEVLEPSSDKLKVVATDPDGALIAKTIKALPSTDFTIIALRIDEKHFIEGSGSTHPDWGLSVKYADGGEEFM